MKFNRVSALTSDFRRSPCGERGLKCHSAASFVPSARVSLPVRGAWIEISGGWCAAGGFSSLPVRGAWIEIFPGMCPCLI